MTDWLMWDLTGINGLTILKPFPMETGTTSTALRTSGHSPKDALQNSMVAK